MLTFTASTGRLAQAECAWGAQRAHEATTDAVLAAYPTRKECESRRGFVHRQRTSDTVSFECLPDTSPYLSQLEAGLREPSIVTVVALANALGIPPGALL